MTARTDSSGRKITCKQVAGVLETTSQSLRFELSHVLSQVAQIRDLRQNLDLSVFENSSQRCPMRRVDKQLVCSADDALGIVMRADQAITGDHRLK